MVLQREQQYKSSKACYKERQALLLFLQVHQLQERLPSSVMTRNP